MELFTKQKPNLNYLKIIGSDAYVLIPKTKQQKLENKSVKGRLVGYNLTGNKGFRIYYNGKIIISRNVIFNELTKTEPSATPTTTLSIHEESNDDYKEYTNIPPLNNNNCDDEIPSLPEDDETISTQNTTPELRPTSSNTQQQATNINRAKTRSEKQLEINMNKTT